MLIYNTYATKLTQKTVQGIMPELEGLLAIRSDALQMRGNIAILTPLAGDMIPSWEHPIYHREKNVCFVDGRAFYDRFGEIRNRTEFENMLTRANLELRYGQEPESFEFVVNGCAAVLAQWVSSTFRQRYPLSEADLGYIQLLTAGFFMSNIYRGKDTRGVGEQLRFSVHQLGSRVLRLPIPFVDEILERDQFKELIEHIENDTVGLPVLAELIQKGVDIPIEDFSGQVLLAYLIPGAWIGLNDRKIAAVATESISTMVYLIYKAMGSTFYRKTKVGQAVDFMKRNAKLDTVQRFV